MCNNIHNSLPAILYLSINLRKHFSGIVSTEDVKEGKPNPEIYKKAIALLNQSKTKGSIPPSECLAVEDSREGIRAAHGAGLKCLAVTNSHAANELSEADSVVPSLEQVNLKFLERLLSTEKQ